MRRLLAWSLASQVLSSASNFLMTLLVARTLGAEDFGRFAMVMSIYIFALLLVRASVGQVLLLQPSASVGSRSVYAFTSVAAAVVTLGVGLLVGLSAPLLAITCLAVTSSLVQDGVRYRAFAAGTPRRAVASDAVWCLWMLIPLAAASVLSTGTVVGLWGSGALVATFAVERAGALRVSLGACRSWAREHRHSAGPYGLESLVFLGSGQVLLVLVAIISGLAAVGQIKAGQLVLSPLVSIATGLSVATTVLARQRYERDGRGPAAVVVVAMSSLLAAVTALWTLLAVSLPQSVGVAVLGDSWDTARSVLPVVGAAQAVAAFSAGALILVRVSRGPRSTLRARLATCWCEPLFGAIGALIGAAAGACVGMVTSQAVSTCVWWRWSTAAPVNSPAPTAAGQ